jgi:hypothetical protein
MFGPSEEPAESSHGPADDAAATAGGSGGVVKKAAASGRDTWQQKIGMPCMYAYYKLGIKITKTPLHC